MTDFSSALRDLSEPAPRGDRVKSAIERAARLAGLTYTRAWDIWYGKARRIDVAESEKIQAALRRKNEEAARNELYELKSRLIRLESILVSSDPDFHRETVDFTREQVRGLSRLDRTVAVRGRS